MCVIRLCECMCMSCNLFLPDRLQRHNLPFSNIGPEQCSLDIGCGHSKHLIRSCHLCFLSWLDSRSKSLMQVKQRESSPTAMHPWKSTNPTTVEPSFDFATTMSPRATISHSEILARLAVVHAAACWMPTMCCSTCASCGFAARGSTRPADCTKCAGPSTNVGMCILVISRRADRS